MLCSIFEPIDLSGDFDELIRVLEFHPFDKEHLECRALRTLVVTVAAPSVLTDKVLGEPKESISDVKIFLHI